MGVSKVTLNGATLMDVTDKTVDTDNLLDGETALRNDGESISGAVVTAAASDTAPAMDGTASAGSATTYSRGDHVHPSDTSRQAVITATGILKGNGAGSVTAAVGGTDYQLPIKTATNPTLTPLNNQFIWTISSSDAFGNSNILISIYETSTGLLVNPEIIVNQSTGAITITINNTTGSASLTAGAYKAVMLGQEVNNVANSYIKWENINK